MQGTAPPPEDEYGLIELGSGVPALSLVFFLAALGSRFLVALLPAELRPFPWGAMLSAGAVPVFSFLGLLTGLVGLRGRQGRGLARAGVFLNAVALVLSLLLVAAFFWILPANPSAPR